MPSYIGRLLAEIPENAFAAKQKLPLTRTEGSNPSLSAIFLFLGMSCFSRVCGIPMVWKSVMYESEIAWFFMVYWQTIGRLRA